MGPPETIRSFISLEFSEKIKQAVCQLQERLITSGGDVKWVKMAGLHLTLKFLGQIPVTKLPAITGALEPIVARSCPLRVKIRGVGVFPDMKTPRIIWLGVEGGEPLKRLQADVEAAINGLSFEPETRSFKPHLTIGRVRSGKRRQMLIQSLGKEAAWEAGDYEFPELFIMKSDLQPSGAVYTPLWSKAFSG